jgi:hypothetical protein
VNPIPPVLFVTSVQKPHRRNQPESMKGKSNRPEIYRPVETGMCEASVTEPGLTEALYCILYVFSTVYTVCTNVNISVQTCKYDKN